MPRTETWLTHFGCGMLLLLALIIIPVWGVVILFLTTVGLTLRNAAVAGGLYKEPLLAEFRRYGDEPRIYPLVSVLFMAGITCFVMLLVLPMVLAQNSYMAQILPTVTFIVLGVILLGGALVAYRHPQLRTSLPRWYADLLQHANRQERRHIGWAWLRLPRLMRMRLNGDNKAFAVWADMVRLTVIYGAYDPDSPWHRWT